MVNSEACGWCDERMKRNNGCARGGGGKNGRSELMGRMVNSEECGWCDERVKRILGEV